MLKISNSAISLTPKSMVMLKISSTAISPFSDKTTPVCPKLVTYARQNKPTMLCYPLDREQKNSLLSSGSLLSCLNSTLLSSTSLFGKHSYVTSSRILCCALNNNEGKFKEVSDGVFVMYSTKEGVGQKVEKGRPQKVEIRYRLYPRSNESWKRPSLENVDSKIVDLLENELGKGFKIGIQGMRSTERRKIAVPRELLTKDLANSIGNDSWGIFYVELLEVITTHGGAIKNEYHRGH